MAELTEQLNTLKVEKVCGITACQSTTVCCSDALTLVDW